MSIWDKPLADFQKAHEALRLQVRHEEGFRLGDGGADGFGGEMASAGGAFHGGGPAGADPVAGEKEVLPRRDSAGSCGVDSGRNAEGGADFFNQRNFDDLGLFHDREVFGEFAKGLITGTSAG